LKVIEDCSQSVGASYKGKPLTLFERAVRFHDVTVRRDFPAKLSYIPGLNYRMNEFTGGVLLAQLRKLDSIVAAVRRNARRVYDGIGDVPGIRLRRLPDPAGELGTGIFLGFATAAQREQFAAGMKAEGVPVAGPAGSIILPAVPEIENKVTVTPRWPSFASPRGQAIRYGKESCPRTIDVLGRYAGVMIGPKHTVHDTDDAIAAIRKVYPTVV
jgi:dTDP-4-amino-4,6-dideoxygalactose transaminase